MEENLPDQSQSFNPRLLGILCFLVGLIIGAGGFYFYATEYLIPQEKSKMMQEMFGGSASNWENYFEESEGEYTNPFTTQSDTGETAPVEAIPTEEYVNPFEDVE